MTIRRGSLYAGAFVLAVGAVTLASSAGGLDRGAVGNAVATLWPVAVIAIGLALLLRRTPAALPLGVAAAAAPGLLLGGSLVAIPALNLPCTGGSDTATTAPATQTQQGTIPSDGAVEFHLACGDLNLTTQAGSGWRLDASDGADRQTSVAINASGFVATVDGTARGWSNPGRVTWTAALPTDPRFDLTTRVDAGRGRLDLEGANLRSLDLSVNAGDLRADLTGASLDELNVEVNAGSTSITLPAHAFTGDVVANAGSVKVCVPVGLAVRVRSESSLGSVRFNGLVQDGGMWIAPGASSAVTSGAAPIADLNIKANVGSVSINPQGGCQ